MPKNPYKTREGGATVTVFVPYDCKNNCPFCVNKHEYRDMTGFSLERILESIRLMDSITPNCDFVFTGGEPMADLDGLDVMLSAIPHTHRVFINTTFPTMGVYGAEEMLSFVHAHRDKITCINISRHMQHFVIEGPDEVLGDIDIPKRVNCVLYKNFPTEKLPDFADRFGVFHIPIQFRYDYTETTLENLYDESNDQIIKDLKRYFTYMGMDGCRMRCGYHFKYGDNHMTYHKTLPYSTITELGPDGVTYDILYDILIKQTGKICSDWTDDYPLLDVNAYRQVIFEPNDQVVREGLVEF